VPFLLLDNKDVSNDVCVVGGCGHVGLPLSIAFALRGKRVAILDTDELAAKKIQQGEMPFVEEGGPQALREALASRNLRIAGGPDELRRSAAVILVVGTPIDGHLSPSFHAIDEVLEQYRAFFRDGQLIVLRSTLYPGTSERVSRWARGAGLNVHVATCPERIAQGFALRELCELPQIVASFSPEGLDAAKELFGCLTKDIVVLDPMEAELAKLYNNAWRYIKFAAANQFYMIANEFGMDFDRVYHGITHKYPRGSDLPRPGFSSGPCLFKDTMQLSAFANNQFFIGHAAMLINEGLPSYIVSRMRQKWNLRSMTVGILGMSFKADIDDVRDSLSYKLRDLLETESRAVICSDPFVRGKGIVPSEEAIDRSDVLIIGVPHAAYSKIEPNGKPFVDLWNVLGQGRGV
jgi:UDP-N-acetyl-D-mannosaminuronic acid dehydrogenase